MLSSARLFPTVSLILTPFLDIYLPRHVLISFFPFRSRSKGSSRSLIPFSLGEFRFAESELCSEVERQHPGWPYWDATFSWGQTRETNWRPKEGRCRTPAKAAAGSQMATSLAKGAFDHSGGAQGVAWKVRCSIPRCAGDLASFVLLFDQLDVSLFFFLDVRSILVPRRGDWESRLLRRPPCTAEL